MTNSNLAAATDQPESFVHIPVLSRELIQGLAVREGGHYLDATVGGGGHSNLILAIADDIQVTALDRDPQALVAAQARLDYGDRIHFQQGNFADYDPGETRFDGIIADLGISSPQVDQPERGFSFRFEAPLDMRMDQGQALTAGDLINGASEAELADIFYNYGEERFSRRIARRIVAQRPFQTTTELAAAIARAVPQQPRRNKARIHPATRVFQALRIAVNEELTALETFLARAPSWLKPGGRIGIISFHSLEDRLIKHSLRQDSELCVLTKKPLIPQVDEIAANPRARSAKLRVAERASTRPSKRPIKL